MTLAAARAVADAVLYEGYLLYPYRASAAKNQSRWQFGVLGPPRAAPAAFAEPPAMTMQCLLIPTAGPGTVTVHLRFLQLQAREAQRRQPDGRHVPVAELPDAGDPVLSWDEAIEQEITLPPAPLTGAVEFPVRVAGGTDEESLGAVGRIVRRRWPLTARVHLAVQPDGDLRRLTVAVLNEHPAPVTTREEAIRCSLLGAHVLIEAHDAVFISLLEPPAAAKAAAARCAQDRCWPVLAGSPGLLLGAPIILYDHPRVAEQSVGAMFDATEIDEILALRVVTMTDEEKAEARATDPRAAAIIDRCESMTPDDFERLHGRWDPATEEVLVGGVPVSRGSLVRIHPNRRADAQDIFLGDQVGRVTAVMSDVDGVVHVGLVLLDDPAADLHDWYGRFYYFAPDELEALS